MHLVLTQVRVSHQVGVFPRCRAAIPVAGHSPGFLWDVSLPPSSCAVPTKQLVNTLLKTPLLFHHPIPPLSKTHKRTHTYTHAHSVYHPHTVYLCNTFESFFFYTFNLILMVFFSIFTTCKMVVKGDTPQKPFSLFVRLNPFLPFCVLGRKLNPIWINICFLSNVILFPKSSTDTLS